MKILYCLFIVSPRDKEKTFLIDFIVMKLICEISREFSKNKNATPQLKEKNFTSEYFFAILIMQ